MCLTPVKALTAAQIRRIAHALSRRQLEVALAVFLLLVAGRFVVSLVP